MDEAEEVSSGEEELPPPPGSVGIDVLSTPPDVVIEVAAPPPPPTPPALPPMPPTPPAFPGMSLNLTRASQSYRGSLPPPPETPIYNVPTTQPPLSPGLPPPPSPLPQQPGVQRPLPEPPVDYDDDEDRPVLGQVTEEEGENPYSVVAMQTDRVSLAEAANSADCVSQLPLLSPDARDMESSSHTFQYEANLDPKFMDKGGFSTSLIRIQQEVESQAKLVLLLEEGERYASILYTWRCCSRAIPAIKTHDQANRHEIHEKTVEVLQPQIELLHQMFHFKKTAVDAFRVEIERLSGGNKKGEFISSAFLMMLAKLLNMFATLDELKNIKASIKNDYSAFRRASEVFRQVSDLASISEAQEVSLFLGTHNNFRSELKKRLSEIAGHEEILCEIVNTCLLAYEQNTYLLPREKHSIIKAIGIGLYLIDGSDISIYKLDAKRKLNLHRIDKIFKQQEIVPLYGDMMVNPFSYVQGTPNFDESKWTHCTSEPKKVDINSLVAKFRTDHNRLLCDLALCPALREPVFDKRELDPDLNREVYNLVLATMQQLSCWTATVVELISWKLAHPTDYLDNPDCPREAEEYERATKYNYSKQEKLALAELITLIKSVQATLLKMEAKITRAIHHHIYIQLQNFVQIQLREPLRKAAKKSKETLLRILNSIRDICGDWARGVSPQSDPVLQGKKDAATGFKVQLKLKAAVPSVTQLYMLQTHLEWLVDKSAGKKSTRKDLDSAHVQTIENILKVSHFWPYLLNFSDTLHACCDLSQLWYREFYLELSQGRRIQFPIDMSIPWMLTNHILELKDASMMDCVFYLLDLYNDSARCALDLFHKQYLFDEIEAEVGLCFEQLVYKLSEQVFSYYKELAASVFMDKKFQSLCKKQGQQIHQPHIAHYVNLLSQRQVQLLGRHINLQKLISQQINGMLLKSLDMAITRFECADLTGVVELDGLLELTRLTHRMLSQYLGLADFSSLLHEANQSVTSDVGRITQHIFFEINYDFLPQYCYNDATNRFVPTVLPFATLITREKPPSSASPYLWGRKSLAVCFNAIYGQYSGFIGMPHYRAICHLLGYQDVAVIVKELLNVIKNTLNDSILQYVSALMRVLPTRLIMPRFEYGTEGVFSYYQAQLTDIMNYSDLQPKMFQSLRELGNAIVFLLGLSQGLYQEEVSELQLAALFQNVIPKPYINKDKEKSKDEREADLQELIKNLEKKYKNQQVVPIISKLGSKEQTECVKEGMTLTRERLCCGLSVFEYVMAEIRTFLSDDTWRGHPPSNGVMNIDDSQEFHRLWSALQFVFCIPPRSANAYTIEQLFGEGLNWAGLTLIILLGQQRRFEAMDFCYHLLKVSRTDQKNDSFKGVDLKKMMDRIRKFQILNYQIMATVNRYVSAMPELVPVIIELSPPTQAIVLRPESSPSGEDAETRKDEGRDRPESVGEGGKGDDEEEEEWYEEVGDLRIASSEERAEEGEGGGAVDFEIEGNPEESVA